MEVSGSQNPISVLLDTKPEVPAGPSTLVLIDDLLPVPGPVVTEDSHGAPWGVVGVQHAHRGCCCYPHMIQLGQRSLFSEKKAIQDGSYSLSHNPICVGLCIGEHWVIIPCVPENKLSIDYGLVHQCMNLQNSMGIG